MNLDNAINNFIVWASISDNTIAFKRLLLPFNKFKQEAMIIINMQNNKIIKATNL